MVYYIETNLIAVIVGTILLVQENRISSRNETSHKLMGWMTGLLIIFGLSDIAAYMFKGVSAVGVHISNMIYYIAIALGTYLWFLFVCIKTDSTSSIKRTMYNTGLPAAILIVLIMLNPLHELFFTVSSDCIYSRGSFLILTWLVEWGYFIAAEIINIRAVIREKQSFRKAELRGYLVFALPLVVAAFVQMIFYGTTTLQIGYMIGLLLITTNKQFYHMHRDEMTGINNKNAFLSYRDYLTASSKDMFLTVIMMDADKFKSINDTLGHIKGDQALKDIALVLYSCIERFRESNIKLYRYAGDEFVIIAVDMTSDERKMLIDMIHQSIDEKNAENAASGEKYVLSLSIGYASGLCPDEEHFDKLLKRADEHMYEMKYSSRNSGV